jgi:hypothetical protein
MSVLDQVRQTVVNLLQNSPNQSQSSSQGPNSGARPTLDAKKLAAEVREKVDKVQDDAFLRQDTINLAYYRGKQWIAWDSMRRRAYEPNKEDGKSRYTGNRIQKVVRTELAKIMRNRLVMSVIPRSSDQADIDAAKLGDKYSEWLEDALKLQKRDESLILWALTTSIAFIHPFWNPTKGDIAGENGERTGDVDLDVLSTFECRWDNTVTEWEDIGWFCKIKPRSVEYIRHVYGAEVKEESGLELSAIQNMSAMWTAPMNGNAPQAPVKGMCQVYEYWEKPNYRYQKGRRVTVADDKVLYYSEDIGFGERDQTERILPFFPLVHIAIPGSIRGTNVTEQLLQPQREYNRTRSQIIDHKDKVAYAKVLVEDGSLLDDITDEQGQILTYKRGASKPDVMHPPSVSLDVSQNMQMLQDEIYFISGQQQVSHGQAPGGDISGYAVSLLLEQDDTVIAPTIEHYAQCKQEYMSYMQKMASFNYTEERKLKITGKDGVEIIPLTGDMLTSYEIRVQKGSVLSSSKPAKQSLIWQMLNVGLLDAHRDRDKILQTLEFGVMDDLYNDAEVDERQAREEQLRWEQGVIETDMTRAVRDFFNHQVHIDNHNRWRKGQKYEALPADGQAAIDLHVDTHKQYIAQEAQQQVLAALQMQQAGQPTAPKQAGTPHNPVKMMQSIGEGDPIGNSMQGIENMQSQPPTP